MSGDNGRNLPLTRNGKDFLDDAALPFSRLHGLIVVTPDMGDMEAYTRALMTILELVPYGEAYERQKIVVSSTDTRFRFIDFNGHMVSRRVKLEKGRLYEWVEST